jgi:4-hydroxy-3-polyprenylbenzoate decarboxylase
MSSSAQSSGSKRILLAITGASGAPYALSLLQVLAEHPRIDLHVIISPAAETILELESGTKLEDLPLNGCTLHDCMDIAAPPASGSWLHQGMIVCPCSMASLANIRHGTGRNLIHRAADVTLKEKLPLILVPRETPLSSIHLENMLGLDRAGARIVPASPGFYHRPDTVQDLINHLVGRILDQLGLSHALTPRWGDLSGQPSPGQQS